MQILHYGTKVNSLSSKLKRFLVFAKEIQSDITNHIKLNKNKCYDCAVKIS